MEIRFGGVPFLPQDRRAGPTGGGARVFRRETAFSGRPEEGLELPPRDVESRLRQEEPAAGLERRVRLGEEPLRIRKFVDDGERQHEVEPLPQVVDAHAVARAQPRVDPVEEPGFLRASAQLRNHPGLHVHGDDLPVAPDEARQLQREEAHARAGLEHDHPFGHVRPEDGARILYEAPPAACQEIPEPPGTHLVRHHFLRCDDRFMGPLRPE